jgi:selenide,water dikinase
MEAFTILPDPQTNGGLLIAVDPAALAEVQEVLKKQGLTDFTEPIGVMTQASEKTVTVK